MNSFLSFLYRHALAVILIASLGILASVFVSQYVFGLQPCVLCVYQRWPYAVAILLAGLGLTVLRRPAHVRGALLLSALAFAVGGGIALFHVGVEQHWWEGTQSCTGGSGATSLEALRAQVLNAPIVRCDDVAWSLFGISMAGWNLVASIGLAAFCLGAFRARRNQGETA